MNGTFLEHNAFHNAQESIANELIPFSGHQTSAIRTRTCVGRIA